MKDDTIQEALDALRIRIELDQEEDRRRKLATELAQFNPLTQAEAYQLLLRYGWDLNRAQEVIDLWLEPRDG